MKNSRLKKNINNLQMFNVFSSAMYIEIEEELMFHDLFCGM